MDTSPVFKVPQKRKYHKISTTTLQIPVLRQYDYGNDTEYSLASVGMSTPSNSSASDALLPPFNTPAAPEHSHPIPSASTSLLPTPSSSEIQLPKPPRPYRRLPKLDVPPIPHYIQSLSASSKLQSPVSLEKPSLKRSASTAFSHKQPRLRPPRRTNFQKAHDILDSIHKDFGCIGPFLDVLFWNRSKKELSDLRSVRHRQMV